MVIYVVAEQFKRDHGPEKGIWAEVWFGGVNQTFDLDYMQKTVFTLKLAD